MADFVIDGASYSSGVLSGPVQMKVMKRLLPLFNVVIGQAEAITQASRRNDEDRQTLKDAGPELAADAVAVLKEQMSDRMAKATYPVAKEIAALSDADEDYIVHACFAVTQWRDERGIYPVMEADGTFGHQRNRSIVVRCVVSMQVLAETFKDLFGSYGIDAQKLMADASGRR